MASLVPVACWFIVGACVVLVVVIAMALHGRLDRARASERLAVERRDRFFATAAQELDAPIVTLREHLAGLDTFSLTPERIAALTGEIDRLRELVAELARVPAPVTDAERSELDVAELVREITAQAPFSDRGPSVIVRASPARVWADRRRLATGLRVLLWVVRREVAAQDSLLVTVSADDEAAYVEIDTGGTGELADAVEQLPAVAYGLVSPTAPAGTTLSLQVASEVARAHGGRLAASARVAQGERLVLELPRGAALVH